MSKKNDDKEFRQLVTDLSAICEAIKGLGTEARDHQLCQQFWHMGDHIVRVVQGGRISGSYGKGMIVELALALTEEHGKGYGWRTLFYARSFAAAYRFEEIDERIKWNHYKVLSKIKDRAKREAFESLVIENRIAASELMRLVKGGEVSKKNGEDAYRFDLEPRKAQKGIYKVVVDTSGKKPVVQLDCGFNFLMEVPVTGLRGLKTGEYVTDVSGGARKSANPRFRRVKCGRGGRYCYDATVVDVVDGDTVVVKLRLGLGGFVKERMRLRGVDAAELVLPEGKLARKFVAKRLKTDARVRVLTYGHDIYGRYVADIFYDEDRFLNREIVESRIAEFLDMGV